jgi:DNA repair protein RecO (recombination protein O)
VPTLVDEAICIRHWDFSETSQTVSLFGRSGGLLRGLAKGAKRPGGRFSGGIDLLTRGQVVAIVKPSRELATLTDWTLLGAWRTTRSDLAANRAAFYMIDLVQRLLGPSDPHPALYDALVGLLDAIEAGVDAETATLVFQVRILGETGLSPHWAPPEGAAATLLFSPSAGGVVTNAADGWKTRRTTLDLLEELATESVAGGLRAAAAADPIVRDRANRLAAAFLRHALGTEPATMRLLFPGTR